MDNQSFGVSRSPYPSKPYESVADLIASKGRYGDTMLMHVNPGELESLDKAYPGVITINPDTGQPEAFLGMLLAGLSELLMAVGPTVTAGLTGLSVPANFAGGIGGTLGAIPSVLGSGLGAVAAPMAKVPLLKLGMGEGGLGSLGLPERISSAIKVGAENIAAHAPSLSPEGLTGKLMGGASKVGNVIGETISTPLKEVGDLLMGSEGGLTGGEEAVVADASTKVPPKVPPKAPPVDPPVDAGLGEVVSAAGPAEAPGGVFNWIASNPMESMMMAYGLQELLGDDGMGGEEFERRYPYEGGDPYWSDRYEVGGGPVFPSAAPTGVEFDYFPEERVG